MTSESTAQPSRADVKKCADELGIDYPANIPTPRLEALIAERVERVEAISEVVAIAEAAPTPAPVLIDGRPADWVQQVDHSDTHAVFYGDPSNTEITAALNAQSVTINGKHSASLSGIVHSPARKGIPARIAFNSRFPFAHPDSE